MSAKHIRVVIDDGGILVDDEASYLNLFSKVDGNPISKKDIQEMTSRRRSEIIDRVNEETLKPSFCRTMLACAGAIEGMNALMRAADVYVATTPVHNAPTWAHDRKSWLNTHFSIPENKIVSLDNKFILSADIYVDNNASRVLEWEDMNPQGLGILWSNENSESDLVRIFDWDSLMLLVKSVARTRSARRSRFGIRN
jgi:5'(3')-deoxyribonucleotidase